MLILTRKLGQKLIINDDIEIVVLECYKNIVKLGVKAPNNVTIYREEVYNEIKKSNKLSSGITPDKVDILDQVKIENHNFNLMKNLKKND